MNSNRLIVGGRASVLSIWQMNHVKSLLEKAYPDLEVKFEFISTRGDRIQNVPLPEIGGKGIFTEELQKALKSGQIDCAIHSLKDLPTLSPNSLTLCAIIERGPSGDVLISRHKYTLESLPLGATVGTSSVRRQAQIKKMRPDLNFKDIRGNMDTRLKKALDKSGPYDAIVAAEAALKRLGLDEHIAEIIDTTAMMPAPAQGAVATQCLASRSDLLQLFKAIHHAETAACTTAERAFLEGLGSGCSLPVSALATMENGQITLKTRVNDLQGQKVINLVGSSGSQNAHDLGLSLAKQAIKIGAFELLGIEK